MGRSLLETPYCPIFNGRDKVRSNRIYPVGDGGRQPACWWFKVFSCS